ncbi:hypothetical protein CK203_080220 [Vitis vinifera]|uniref:RRM domain-containing protein n=1 Tax=Vitis vinifera TaxID=29760 RepID=A0A438ENW3_VITVI|nr:hypothetical protein CK203_080220 [Vitis vinifera]
MEETIKYPMSISPRNSSLSPKVLPVTYLQASDNEMATEAAAKRALALDGADMGGLFLKIQPYKTTRANKSSDFAPEMVEGYNRIYVGNLPWDITEDEVRKFFSRCNVSSIRFGMDKETQEFRGYAHVDFSDNPSLTMALKLDQEIVCGRPAKIRCAVPKKGAKDYSTPAPSSEKAENDGGLTSGSGKMREGRATSVVNGAIFHQLVQRSRLLI